jgi:hypothetical protein
MSEIKLKTCLCCGDSLPIATQFGNFNGRCAAICLHCEVLSIHDAVNLTAGTIAKHYRMLIEDKSTRLEARRAAKRAAYATYGKRCACCHHYKPVDHYNACTSRADGLQPNCRACDALRVQLLGKPGGLATWRLTRAALRAAAAQVQIAAQSDVERQSGHYQIET